MVLPSTIQLQDDTQNLDEVIVVGYSVQKKKDLTGAVSVLEVGDLKDTPVIQCRSNDAR